MIYNGRSVINEKVHREMNRRRPTPSDVKAVWVSDWAVRAGVEGTGKPTCFKCVIYLNMEFLDIIRANTALQGLIVQW